MSTTNHVDPPTKTNIRAVLFDLDGTLVDSIGDLTHSANAAREALQLTPLTETRISQFIGKGATSLIHRTITDSLDNIANEADFAIAMAAFKNHYHAINGQHTRLLPFAIETLSHLKHANYQLGLVTNKPSEFTHPLLQQLALNTWFDVIVCGDTCKSVKPSPEPIRYACQALALTPDQVLFVGDSINDVEAANATPCSVLVVEGGYHENTTQNNEDFNASGTIKTLYDVTRWLK